MRFVNVMDEGRVTDEEKSSVFIAVGNETDPHSWNTIMRHDGEGGYDSSDFNDNNSFNERLPTS